METLANTAIAAALAEKKALALSESQLGLKDSHLSDDDVDSASTSSPKSGHDSDSGDHEKRSRRRERYSVTNNKTRYELINMIEKENISIKKAAEMLNINYSTAKSILGMYKKEGRIVKKTIRKRSNKTKESNNSTTPLIGKPEAAAAGSQMTDANGLQTAIANQNAALQAIYAASMLQNQGQGASPADNLAFLQLIARLQAPQQAATTGFNQMNSFANNVLVANQLQALIQQAQIRNILAAAQNAKTEEVVTIAASPDAVESTVDNAQM